MTTTAISPILSQWFDERKETMGSGRQRDQQRQGPVVAVVRSGTNPQTRYGYERERCGEPCASSTWVCTCLYLTTAWLVLLAEGAVDVSQGGSVEDNNNDNNSSIQQHDEFHVNHKLVSEVSLMSTLQSTPRSDMLIGCIC